MVIFFCFRSDVIRSCSSNCNCSTSQRSFNSKSRFAASHILLSEIQRASPLIDAPDSVIPPSLRQKLCLESPESKYSKISSHSHRTMYSDEAALQFDYLEMKTSQFMNRVNCEKDSQSRNIATVDVHRKHIRDDWRVSRTFFINFFFQISNLSREPKKPNLPLEY
jgi:hypothetical protein